MEPQATIVDELRKGWAPDSPYLGKGKHYPDFLKFFQDEMEKKGWQDVVKEYVFNGDPRSDDLFGRLFSGKQISSSLISSHWALAGGVIYAYSNSFLGILC